MVRKVKYGFIDKDAKEKKKLVTWMKTRKVGHGYSANKYTKNCHERRGNTFRMKEK